MKNLIVVLLLSVLLIGCNHKTPCVDTLFVIHNSQYVLSVNDCVDKSVAYCNALQQNGYVAYVMVGDIDWDVRPHAWVEFIDSGEIFWADPITSMYCKPVKNWRDRVAKYRYNKDATISDIRTYTNIMDRL